MEKENIRVHYKSTVWTELRFECTPIQKEVLLRSLAENGDIDCMLGEDTGFEESETMFDTEEFIPPEENNGYETIQVYDGNSKIIWDNGKRDNHS